MTKCTFFDPATGVITQIATLSDETLEHYVDSGANALLDVAGDPETQYVLNNELVDFTPEELAAKLGMAPGWVWQMPERIAVDTRALDQARAEAWGRIKAARDVAEFGQFECDGRVYDGNEDGTRRVAGGAQLAAIAAIAGVPFSTVFTLADNTAVTLTGAEMMAVGVAKGNSVEQAFATGRALRAQIYAATTIAELDAINWPQQEL